MGDITLKNVVLPENCVKFYTSSPIDNGIETKIPISLMQYDSGTSVVAFTILERNAVYIPKEGTEINVRFEKPDGHGVYTPCVGFDENGIVYFIVTLQMTAADGSGTCCLELKTENGLKYTKKVPVYISKNPVNNENIESTDEYKTLLDIYDEVKKIGGIVVDNQQAIQEIHDNLSVIQQVPSFAQQTQENANQVSSNTQEVLTAKQSVDESLSQVLQSEQNAKQSEQNAKQSEIIASQSAEQTQKDAQTTTSDRQYVESVMPNIENANTYATEAKSWAVGGTGSRPDEETNNAKYWAEQAASMVSGSLGYFDTPELLEQAHPTGKDGDWAIVGSTKSIWIWDSSSNKFIDTLNGIDLSNYYTKSESDEIFAKKDELGEVVKNIILNVQPSSWIQQDPYYISEFPAEGCTADSNIVSINLNKNNNENIGQTDVDNFSNLFDFAETSDNKIVLYSNNIPQTTLSLICAIVN